MSNRSFKSYEQRKEVRSSGIHPALLRKHLHFLDMLARSKPQREEKRKEEYLAIQTFSGMRARNVEIDRAYSILRWQVGYIKTAICNATVKNIPEEWQREKWNRAVEEFLLSFEEFKKELKTARLPDDFSPDFPEVDKREKVKNSSHHAENLRKMSENRKWKSREKEKEKGED